MSIQAWKALSHGRLFEYEGDCAGPQRMGTLVQQWGTNRCNDGWKHACITCQLQVQKIEKRLWTLWMRSTTCQMMTTHPHMVLEKMNVDSFRQATRRSTGALSDFWNSNELRWQWIYCALLQRSSKNQKLQNLTQTSRCVRKQDQKEWGDTKMQNKEKSVTQTHGLIYTMDSHQWDQLTQQQMNCKSFERTQTVREANFSDDATCVCH